MNEFGIKNMDQVAPVCSVYRELFKVSYEGKTDMCSKIQLKPWAKHINLMNKLWDSISLYYTMPAIINGFTEFHLLLLVI